MTMTAPILAAALCLGQCAGGSCARPPRAARAPVVRAAASARGVPYSYSDSYFSEWRYRTPARPIRSRWVMRWRLRLP